MAFKYTLNFVTAADLAGAVAADKAVAKIGTTADETGDKLDKMSEAGKSGGDSLVESLENAGEKGGEGLVGKLNTKLTALGPAVLIPAAIGIGTAIGGAIGGAIEDVFTGEMDDRLDDLFAITFSQKAQVAGERFRQTLHTEMAQLNRDLIEEQKAFWQEYNNTAPQNAGDWLKTIGEQADAAKEKLSGLMEIQTALLKLGKTQIEQDYLDEKQRIENDPMMSGSQKVEAQAANDARKAEREAAQRNEERLIKAREIAAGVKNKSTEVDALAASEAVQKRRAEAEANAETNAKITIDQVKKSGGQLSPSDEQKIREQTYAKTSQETGILVTPGQDEEGELKKIKAERLAAERELLKLKREAVAKAKALALEELADNEATTRTQKRTQVTTVSKVESARQKEYADEEAAAMKRDQAIDKEDRANITPIPERDLPKPGKEQTSPESTEDMREKLRIMSQTTGDAGLKMALETLKNKLSDGGSAAELKEAAALMERAQSGNNDAVRQMAAAMRAAVESQNAALKAAVAEIASLRATVEAGKQRS